MSIYHIGIDPGMSGAVAAVRDDGSVADVFDVPILKGGKDGKNQYDIAEMVLLLRAKTLQADTLAVLERVSAMPGQGVTSMFRFGEGFGIWQGILSTLGVPYALVRPQTWSKAMLSGEPKGDCRGLIVARRRWPTAPLGRKKDEGRADALLLAEYGRLHHWNREKVA